jgi:uncharacterized membrane protein (UPF0127 family)
MVKFRAAEGLVFCLSAIFIFAACKAEPRVFISTRSGKQLTVRVEVADTPYERELGLQYRRELEEDRGMLFVFPVEREQSFWMKNTPVSLDLIFIDSQQRIVGIIPRAVPFSTQTLSVNLPSRFVLEVNGGFSKRHGLQAGDRVRFEGVSLEDVKA